MRLPAIILTFALIIAGCTSKVSDDKESAKEAELRAETVQFDQFSDLYPALQFRELYVYPGKSSFIDSNYAFKGVLINQSDLNRFNKIATHELPASEEFYAVHSFLIDTKRGGLITRTTDMYTSSRISLWVYDISAQSVTLNLELANRFGDAGAVEEVRSYLFFDDSSVLNVLTYRFNSEDMRVSSPPENRVVNKHAFLLTKFEKSGIDTISKDSIFLNEKYGRQLKKLREF